jgi:hypothetical protein
MNLNSRGRPVKTSTTTSTPTFPSSGSVSVDWTAFGHSPTNVSVTGRATSASTLLLLFVATDSPSGPNLLTAVSGGGLTWMLVGRENVEQGDSEIWEAVEPAAQGAFTVTGTEANRAAPPKPLSSSSPPLRGVRLSPPTRVARRRQDRRT